MDFFFLRSDLDRDLLLNCDTIFLNIYCFYYKDFYGLDTAINLAFFANDLSDVDLFSPFIVFLTR